MYWLSKYNIKAKCAKNEFFNRMFKFLGHMVDEEGLHPFEVEAITDLRAPNDIKDLQILIIMIY